MSGLFGGGSSGSTQRPEAKLADPVDSTVARRNEAGNLRATKDSYASSVSDVDDSDALEEDLRTTSQLDLRPAQREDVAIVSPERVGRATPQRDDFRKRANNPQSLPGSMLLGAGSGGLYG